MCPRLSPRFRMHALLVLAAFALTASASNSARANSFQIVGGTAFTLQSNFNPSGWTGNTTVGFTSPDGIYIGKTITVFDSSNATSGGLQATGLGQTLLNYSFQGFEAAYTNYSQDSFSFTSPTFTNQTSHNGDSVSLAYNFQSSKLVPFLFDSSAYSLLNGLAINGTYIGSNVKMGFAIDPNNSGIAFAFFKDIARGDNDFDDMVVEIRDPVATPIPASLPLFAAGMGVLGLLGRRRKPVQVSCA